MKNKHAYLIMAYKDIDLLKVLMKQIDFEKNDIYIHIDKKSNKIDNSMLINICEKSNINIYKKFKIYWGDYSQTKCELFLLEEALKYNYSYYHLLSGSDLLIKNAKQIYNFFENENKGKEFIHFESEKINVKKIEWFEKYHIFQKYLRNSNIKFINKCFKLLEIVIIKIQYILKVNRNRSKEEYLTGANWFSITGELAKYIVDNKEMIEKKYKLTRSSDEIFLQTLVYNSSFKKNLYNKSFDNNYEACMRYIDWNRGKPYTFKLEDYNLIINSNMMFARKFSGSDERLINRIYEATNTTQKKTEIKE